MAQIMRACVLVLAGWIVGAHTALAQDSARLAEQDVKAGLVYHFLRYTEWPDGDDGPMVVCTFGRVVLGGRLEPMEGRTVNHRRIEVRGATAETLQDCAVVVVDAEARALWPDLRARLNGVDVLTVSDFDGFAAAGGMVEFARVNRRIDLRINVRALNEAGLVVQDRMLRLAGVSNSGGGQ
jgi:hypothetical protein